MEAKDHTAIDNVTKDMLHLLFHHPNSYCIGCITAIKILQRHIY